MSPRLPRVFDDPCTTCVFLPGNAMHLRPGRLREIVRHNLAVGAALICHDTLGNRLPDLGEVVCEGWFRLYGDRTAVVQVMARLAMLTGEPGDGFEHVTQPVASARPACSIRDDETTGGTTMTATEATAEAPTPTDAEVPDGLVRCGVCEQNVAPTREGGTRPRDHNDRSGSRCAGSKVANPLPDCTRCGGAPDAPVDGCTSALYHPEVITRGKGENARRLGNAAAAGEVVGVSGEHYQWLARTPPPGPRRAPAHAMIRDADGHRFYDLGKVEQFAAGRPGPGGRGPRKRVQPVEPATD